MTVVEMYDHKRHAGVISKWLKAKNLTLPDERLLSPHGIIMNATAIGFLVKTDSKVAYIDHVATNPQATKEYRKESLDFLFKFLENEARRCGYLMVQALASLPIMRSRFENSEYSHYGEFGLYYKVLGE